MRGQPGFFDIDEGLKRLSDLGDHLAAFQSALDFEMFRADLVAALAYSDGAQGGRPPFDPVMMFKILIIQAIDNLSDEMARIRKRRPQTNRSETKSSDQGRSEPKALASALECREPSCGRPVSVP